MILRRHSVGNSPPNGYAHWLFALMSAPPAPSMSSPSAVAERGSVMQNGCARLSSRGLSRRRLVDEAEADLVIVSEGTKVAKAAAGRTIRLRAEPEASGAKDSSIYRYDRAALLVALKSAGGGRGR